MSDETKQPEAPESATGTAPEAEKPDQQERVFTAKEVEAIVRDRLARVKKEPKSEQKAEPKKEEAKADGNETVADIKQRLEFQDSLNDLMDDLDWKPTRQDRELLRSMFKAGGAEQMAALAERLKGAGTDPTKGSGTPPAPATPAAAPGKPYVAPPGAPNSPADILEQNPAKWSRAHIERLQKDGTFRQEVEKFYQSGQGGPFRRQIPKVS